jgi:hypothetical protein
VPNEAVVVVEVALPHDAAISERASRPVHNAKRPLNLGSDQFFIYSPFCRALINTEIYYFNILVGGGFNLRSFPIYARKNNKYT